MKQTTVRLPDPLHEELRTLSFQTRVPMNTLVMQSVHFMLQTRARNPGKVAEWLAQNPPPDDPEVPGAEPVTKEAAE